MNPVHKARLLEFLDWAVKAVIVAGVTMLWNLNSGLEKSMSEQARQAGQITELKGENDSLRSEIRSVRAEMVSKDEFNATLKRVEQQLEIVLLKAELKMKNGGQR